MYSVNHSNGHSVSSVPEEWTLPTGQKEEKHKKLEMLVYIRTVMYQGQEELQECL